MGGEIKIIFFGTAAQAAGRTEENLAATDTAALRSQLHEKYPALARIPYRMALNKSLLKAESALKTDDIIAILPPFQGG